MSNTYKIGEKPISLSDISKIIKEDIKSNFQIYQLKKLFLVENIWIKRWKSSSYPIYGINTGFGSLCNNKISEDSLDNYKKI